MARPELGKVVSFPGSSQEVPSEERITKFDKEFAADVVDFYDQMGTDSSFLEILDKHVNATRLAVNNKVEESYLTTRQSNTTPSSYDVGGSSWERLLVLSQPQRFVYANAIEKAMKSLTVANKITNLLLDNAVDLSGNRTETTETQTKRIMGDLAIDWIFYEQSADMLANSVYLQRRFGHYVHDFNGQSFHYRTELTVARDFLEKYSDIAPRSDRSNIIVREYRNFRAGAALAMLADSMVRKEVVGSLTEAQWVTTNIGLRYPVPKNYVDPVLPQGKDDLFFRLSNLEPRTK